MVERPQASLSTPGGNGKGWWCSVMDFDQSLSDFSAMWHLALFRPCKQAGA
jgi:hypothetical protein